MYRESLISLNAGTLTLVTLKSLDTRMSSYMTTSTRNGNGMLLTLSSNSDIIIELDSTYL